VKIFLNYAMSADGKISTWDRKGSNFSSRADKHRMDRIRSMADLIVVGAETVRRDNPPFHIKDKDHVRGRVAEGRPPHPDLCVLTASGRLPSDLRIFHQSHQKVLVATPGDWVLPQGITADVAVIRIGGADPLGDLPDQLAEKGYHQILVEGGGRVNAMFIQKNLVDEIYTTISPVVLGGAAAPSPVAGRGFDAGEELNLRLLDEESHDNELFLHYKVLR